MLLESLEVFVALADVVIDAQPRMRGLRMLREPSRDRPDPNVMCYDVTWAVAAASVPRLGGALAQATGLDP